MKPIFLILLTVALIAGCENNKPSQPETVVAVADKPVEATPADAQKADTPAPTSQTSDKKAAGPVEDLGPGETKLYGSRFTIIEPAISLGDALTKSAEHEGPYKVEATMEKVCVKKGCWFTLTAEGVETPVRVRMKDYGFFVPRNAKAAKAVVEGTLVSREMPQKEAQHYAEDEGKNKADIAKITGAQRTYEFTATSVEVAMPKS